VGVLLLCCWEYFLLGNVRCIEAAQSELALRLCLCLVGNGMELYLEKKRERER
jgi:hypothetical protein